MTQRTTFNAKLFAAVNLAKANEEMRFYLNGVYVMPAQDKGVILTATNGHIGLMAHDANGHIDEPQIIQLNRTSSQLKVFDTIALSNDMDVAELSSDKKSDACTYKIVEGTYPDFGNVINSGEIKGDENLVCLDTDYLKTIGNVGDVFGKGARVTVRTFGHQQPINFNIIWEELSVQGILMPRRDVSPFDLKDFLRHWEKDSEQKKAA